MRICFTFSSLGLVDVIDVAAPHKRNAAKQQHYQYLIVIDFEATCWEKDDVKWRKPEIIGKYIILSKVNHLHCLSF